MQKENLNFGFGNFVGVLNNPDFEALPAREQARIVGWADSCPVVNELTNPANTDPGRGPEAMLERYGEVNQWFTFIGRVVDDVNPDLFDQLMTPVARFDSEPVGKYEPESVPAFHLIEMSPLGTLPGYALPRLLTKQIGDGTVEENQTRLFRGLEALDVAASEATNPSELLAIFAREVAAKQDLKAEAILSGSFSKGWFGEHNAVTMLDQVKEAFKVKAPGLWKVYSGLTDEQKLELKLA